MSKSTIEWTNATWNPIRGCSIVSEGCRNCYAMRTAHRFKSYKGLTRRGPHGPTWTGDVRFVPEALEYPLKLRKPHNIFVNSMSDLFHPAVSDGMIDQIFAVMALAPQHTFQVLTKRPERMLAYMRNLQRVADEHAPKTVNLRYAPSDVLNLRMLAYGGLRGGRFGRAFTAGWPLLNVWLGVSVEDQRTADERIPPLLQTPAAVRWVSAEPLLGPVNLEKWLCGCPTRCEHDSGSIACTVDGYLDWTVCGGESGPGARPMHPDWARSLRDQCVAANVPFFFKQWGEYLPLGSVFKSSDVMNPCSAGIAQERLSIAIGSHGTTFWKDEDDPVPASDADAYVMSRVGKKTAGRLLDGREWNEYPQAKAVAA